MSQLPAYLQKYQTRDVGAVLSANLGSAMPPHVSIAGGRFTLVDASNNELPGAWFDQKIGVYIDACIVDVNDHKSRVYFVGAYDSNAEGVRPDCFSDNGVGPSVSAQSPQAPSCQPDPTGQFGCKWAVWGSKINQNGKKVPACSEKQKVALLVPGYNVLFLLAIPPNSHGPLREYTELCKGNNIKMVDLLTRIYFKQGEVGTLQFMAVSYIDEPTAELRQAAWNEKRTDALVGRNDVPRPAIAVPVVSLQQIPPPTQQWPAQQVQQPGPLGGTGATPVQNAPQPGPLMQNPAPSVATTSPSEPQQGRRKRRTAAEMAAANGGQQPGPGAQGVAQAHQAPFPVSTQAGVLPGQLDMGLALNAGASTNFGIAQPSQPSGEVKAMLDDFFGQQG